MPKTQATSANSGDFEQVEPYSRPSCTSITIEEIRALHIAETPGWAGPRDMFGVPVAVVKWEPKEK